MDHCTCEPGRAHDGSEFGPCEFCEAEAELASLDGTLGNLRQLQQEPVYYRLTKWGRMVVDDAASALENVLSNKPFPDLRTGGGR